MSVNSTDFAKTIRKESLRMVHRARASHIGSGLSIVDILAVLYKHVLKINPKYELWEFRDRFILSKGHACVPLYATLAHIGYFPVRRLLEYGSLNTVLMHHVSHKVEGVEFSTGSLGHGLPFALGKALHLKNKYGNEAPRVFVLLGDGELAEGSNWEAFLIAAHHGINNLTVIVDNNNLQSFKSVEETLSLGNLGDKLRSFNWDYFDIDGHNHDTLRETFDKTSNRPRLINCRTIKGKGISFMEGSVKWHYSNPSDSELIDALKEIDDEK